MGARVFPTLITPDRVVAQGNAWEFGVANFQGTR